MTAKELYLEAMRRADAGEREGFIDLFTDDCNYVVPGAEVRGKQQLREWLKPFWEGFPNFRHDLGRTVSESDDVVVGEGVWTGVHTGTMTTPGGDLPPTGRTVSFRFALVGIRAADGEHVQTVNLYFDQLEFLGQLGVLPESAAA